MKLGKGAKSELQAILSDIELAAEDFGIDLYSDYPNELQKAVDKLAAFIVRH